MAVQGATPSRIIPALYCSTCSGERKPEKRWARKSQAKRVMVKGFTAQFMKRVRPMGLGERPALLISSKLICTMMG